GCRCCRRGRCGCSSGVQSRGGGLLTLVTIGGCGRGVKRGRRGAVGGLESTIAGAVALGGGGGVFVRTGGATASPRGRCGHESTPSLRGAGRQGPRIGDVERVPDSGIR